MGSNLSIVNDTDHTWLCHLATDDKPFETFTLSTPILSALLPLSASPSAAAEVAAETLQNTLCENGYTRLEPHTDEIWNEVSMTKPQQVHCVWIYAEGGVVVREEIFMDEIKSGGAPTALSRHYVKWWYENHEVRRTRTPA